jgi:hypothetical protein
MPVVAVALRVSSIVMDFPPLGGFSLMNRERLDENINTIRKYTAAHAELRVAHHFLYDLPLNKDARAPEIVVIGINPGETQVDREAYPGPTEETWNFDFHEQASLGRSRGSIHWRKNAAYFANGRPVIFTELFFWSSNDQGEFKERFGPLWDSPHLSFCVNLNRCLIDEYQPKSIIFVGLSDVARVAGEFGLRHVYTLKMRGHRLVEHYQDALRSWYFTKHWSGSFGFSNIQKDAILKYIERTS